MDVYVVSNEWHREGSTIIGAAGDLDGAKTIADRLGGKDEIPAVGGWMPWADDHVPPGVVRRDALTADGHTHPSLSQTIVSVPLAVGVDWVGDPVPLRTERIKNGIYGGTPEDVVTNMQRVIEMVSEARAGLRHAFGEHPDRVRVGTGAAWDYMQRAIDSVPKVATAPDSSNITAVMGIPIVRDPDIPPDQIRIGSWAYVVGTAAGPIPEGSMIAIKRQGLLESMRPRNPFPPADGIRYRGFTSPYRGFTSPPE